MLGSRTLNKHFQIVCTYKGEFSTGACPALCLYLEKMIQNSHVDWEEEMDFMEVLIITIGTTSY